MNKIFLTTVLTFSLCAKSLALTCPDSDTIKNAGLDTIAQAKDQTYLVSKIDHYNTSDKWQFTIYNISATSQYDAYLKGTVALGMIAKPTPILIQGYHVGCSYDVGFGYKATSFLCVYSGC